MSMPDWYCVRPFLKDGTLRSSAIIKRIRIKKRNVLIATLHSASEQPAFRQVSCTRQTCL